MFKKQIDHVVFALVLILCASLATIFPATKRGELFGIGAESWYWLALVSAFTHQIYVLLSWRAELYHRWLSRYLGPHAFRYHAVVFMTLLLSRLLFISLLATANAHSVEIRPIFYWPLVIFAVCAAGAVLYNVKRYFTFTRAMGADHFWPERYRACGLERRGLFRIIDNLMYTFGMAILWLPAIALKSQGAMFMALLHHLYVWVHYFTVEKPDMAYIYEGVKERASRLATLNRS